jgi:hypothetical protein
VREAAALIRRYHRPYMIIFKSRERVEE